MKPWEQVLEAARQELVDARYEVQTKRRELRKAQERLDVAQAEFNRLCAIEAVWQSLRFPSVDAARRRALELRAMEAKEAGENPVSVCSNLGHLAFHVHHYLLSTDLGHPQGSLSECPDCYNEVEEAVRAAAKELDWIKEVHRG